MDCKPASIDERDPTEAVKFSCLHCEHTFSVFIGTIQLTKSVKIKCPNCGEQTNIYVNPENTLCVE